MENTRNDEQNEIKNNTPQQTTLEEILFLLNGVQNSDLQREQLINKKSEWIRNERKLSNTNFTFEITFTEILENIERAEKVLSQLTETAESLKYNIELQYSENLKNSFERWANTTRKIQEYALKFPQAFITYTQKNLSTEVEKYRVANLHILEEINDVKLQRERLTNSEIPNELIMLNFLKYTDDARLINIEVKKAEELSEQDTDTLINKKEDLMRTIEELKNKLTIQSNENLIRII